MDRSPGSGGDFNQGVLGPSILANQRTIDIIFCNTGKEVTLMCNTCKAHNPGKAAAKPAAKPAKKKAPARKK